MNNIEIKKENQILCFDLNDDENPKGGIIVRSNAMIKEHNVILPFDIQDEKNAINILSTTASFHDFSVVNYKCLQGQNNVISTIGFTPTMSQPENEKYNIDDLQDGLYLIKSGFERTFIYNGSLSLKLNDKFQDIHFDSLKVIAVKLPFKSKGLELKGGKTTDPIPFYENNRIKYFDLDSTEGKNRILISYLLPPNKLQLQFFDLLLKLFGALILPFIDLAFIKSTLFISKRTKRIITSVIAVIHTLILLYLIYIALTNDIELSKIFDLIAIAIGAIWFFVVVWLKDKSIIPNSPS